MITALIIVILAILTAVSARIARAQSELLFQKTWGTGNNNESGTGVAIDFMGNIYVVGEAPYLGPGNASVYKEVFLLKYDPLGSLIWQRIWSSNGSCDDSPSDVAVDSSGNIYVTGSTFSGGNASYVGDIFLLKFDSSGDFIWQRTYGSSGNDEGFGVAADAADNIYVTGAIGEFGMGSWDTLLLKVDSSGDLLWQKTYGGISSDYGRDLAVDSSGYIYVTGSTSSFGSGMSDVFLLKVDSFGDLLWQRTWGPSRGFGSAYGNAVAVDSFGDIYLTGNFGNPVAYDILVLKFNASGNFVWQRIWDGGDWDYAEDIAVDYSGGIYVGGYVTGFDVLLVRVDSSGNHIGQVTWGNNAALGASQKCFSVAVDSSGNPLLTGFVEIGPPYTFGYPNGTISESSFDAQVPNFVINTPTFPLFSHNGIVMTPSGNEDNTGKIGDVFLVKFAQLSYTLNYTENPPTSELPPLASYGLISFIVILTGAITAILLQRRERRLAPSVGAPALGKQIVATQSSTPPPSTERTTNGFILSLIAGITIIISSLALMWQSYVYLPNLTFGTMGAVGFGAGVVVLLGATLIRTPEKRAVGSILVIVFSVISIIGLGGFFVGFILGIAGGALCLRKPDRAKPGFAISIAGVSLSLFISVVALLAVISYRPSGGWGAIFTPGSYFNPLIPGLEQNITAISIVATVSAVIAVIGALLIYMSGKEVVGGILVITFSLIGVVIFGLPLGLYNIVGIIGGILAVAKNSKKAMAGFGFASSVAAGALILITGLALFMSPYSYAPSVFYDVVAIISGFLVIVGAVLGYVLRKEKAGGILMIAFSLATMITATGIIIGPLLGIIGGIIALIKESRTPVSWAT